MSASGRLADELRALGRKEGLDAVGICDARPFTEAKAAIEDRKDRGLAAGMQFTFRNPARSTDPSRSVPGARSLFVGARRYIRDAAGPGDAGPTATVARYSWVDHYRPLREALGSVAGRLRAEGYRAVVLADDNALVDRAAAVRAGIGWYGKNSNVLLPGAGSWFVLGSVVSDAPLVDRPPVIVEDGCGSCHRCLDDCPTGAIVAPGQIDARRCLAWILQAPGVFPLEYREALGARIYGCDDCQETCPVNRRAVRRHPPAPADPGSQAFVDILEILGSDDASLEAEYGRWYIPHRDFRYLRRNAIVVLGNTGQADDPAVVSALVRLLADADPIIRAHAVWAAARIGRRDLLVSVEGDHDPMVQAELVHAGERS